MTLENRIRTLEDRNAPDASALIWVGDGPEPPGPRVVQDIRWIYTTPPDRAVEPDDDTRAPTEREGRPSVS